MEKKSKKPLIGIISLTIGILALAGGAAFFIIKNNEKPAVRDAEFLVFVGEWVMQSDYDPSLATDCLSTAEETEEPVDCLMKEESELNQNVIWKFTEIGKGVLTNNNHIDDHEFKWSIDGDKFKIETDWLYILYEDLTYSLDQENKTLTITRDDGEKATFKPLEKAAEETTEE